MSHSLPYPNEAPDYYPSTGERVRILEEPYRGKFGTVVSELPGPRGYLYAVRLSAESVVHLAPNELIKAAL